MTIRSELQTRLKAYADSLTPILPLAIEGVPFTKPSTAFLECFVSPSETINPTVDAKRTRERGVFTVNVWAVAGQGMGYAEGVARGIVAAFPVVPIINDICIERTPSTSKSITDVSGFIIIPITISYRYEGYA